MPEVPGTCSRFADALIDLGLTVVSTCCGSLPSRAQVEPGSLEEAVRFWTSSSDARAALFFDKFCRPNVNPVSHCC
jgi:hypothetical protein